MTDYISCMSADSKLIERGYAPHFFRACLGTCLGFSIASEFPERYDKKIETICKDHGIKRERSILKSYDLAKECGDDRKKYMEILSEFTAFLGSNNVHINIVYTSFVLSKLPTGITKYGDGKSPSRKIGAIEFIQELNNYYPYISAWIVAKSVMLRNTKIYLDNFEGEITNAWDELRAHHEVKILPRGDLCNPFISSADIVTKYVDEYLSLNRMALNEDNIKSALLAADIHNPHVFYVGHGHLPDIVPRIQKSINCQDYYARPMTFVIKEDLLEKESLYIESSPAYQKILSFACEKKTGVRFFSSNEDHKRIQKGDYMIYLGKNGKEVVDFLNALGVEIIPINIHDHPAQKELGNFKKEA
jgi:hypothetical protein